MIYIQRRRHFERQLMNYFMLLPPERHHMPASPLSEPVSPSPAYEISRLPYHTPACRCRRRLSMSFGGRHYDILSLFEIYISEAATTTARVNIPRRGAAARLSNDS